MCLIHNRPHPRVAITLLSIGVMLGAISFLVNLVASPHYGWLLHRWAVFFFLAVVSTTLGIRFAGRRTRWVALLMLVILAISAIDPLRRILIYGAWWDA
ncbi:hypothetical protein GRI58_15165 [Porphyrobacter algicida]|nr:hypothetical protein [Qipengyuania algicida]